MMKKTITIILLVSLLLPAGCSHTTEVSHGSSDDAAVSANESAETISENPISQAEPDAESAVDAAQAAEEAERRNEILRAILKLPKKYRLIIHLYYYEDYDTKEIAGILRMNEATVRTRLARGRKILKEVFSDV